MFKIHESLIGAKLYPIRKGESPRTILACWMEEPGHPAHRPTFVVLALNRQGENLKINLPSEDWLLNIPGCTDTPFILKASLDAKGD